MSAATTNVLLIGGGGREHALASAIARSPSLGTLYATHSTNPGIAALAQPVDVPHDARNLYRLEQFCEAKDIGLVVIGPEDPLAEGFADKLGTRRDGSPRAVLGCSASAARLEADKAFAKQLMRSASVPTAEGRVFDRYEAAHAYLETHEEPQVIKAAGLAKGKGVIVPRSNEEGLEALEAMMVGKRFGDAGNTVVIEERLTGREVSVLALVDGRTIAMLPLCQDHKRLGNGDSGPNTGGMGAFCPAPALDDATLAEIETEILVPTVDALHREGIAFRGVLYAGIMLTPAGPKTLEFNVRFGDPECQPLMARLESDAVDLFTRTATGQLDHTELKWSPKASVCVVLASEGYPEKPRTGVVIEGLDSVTEADLGGGVVFHAGTKRNADGGIITAGGRVLGVTALGDTLGEARDRAYEACKKIRFPGMVYRSDIGSGL